MPSPLAKGTLFASKKDMRSKATMLLPMLLAGCSQSSGIKAIDDVRDRVALALGMGPEVQPVGDAALEAAKAAQKAGATGDPKAMAQAVGVGTGRVLCAGATMRKPVAQQMGRSFERDIPEMEGKREAIDMYKKAVEAAPEMPNPCR